MPRSTCEERINSKKLAREAERFGFNAHEYFSDGYTVLKNLILSEAERTEALAVALRVRQKSQGEFVSM